MKQLHLDDSRLPATKTPRKSPRKVRQKEVETTPAMLDYLTRRGCFVWRNNSGVVWAGKRCIRFGFKGSADIIGLLPDGRFLAVENKSNGKPVTPEQVAFLDAVRSRGGVGVVVTGAEDLIRQMEEER